MKKTRYLTGRRALRDLNGSGTAGGAGEQSSANSDDASGQAASSCQHQRRLPRGP